MFVLVGAKCGKSQLYYEAFYSTELSITFGLCTVTGMLWACLHHAENFLVGNIYVVCLARQEVGGSFHIVILDGVGS